MALIQDPLEGPLSGPEREKLYKTADEALSDLPSRRGISTPTQGVQVADATSYLRSLGFGGGQTKSDAVSASDSSWAAALTGGSSAALASGGSGDDAWARALTGQGAAPAEQGNFSRGLSVSGKQLKQTAYGTAALVGDTVGSDKLKEWGLKGYQAAEKEVQAISKESDSFTNAVQSGEIGKWLSYSSGYLLGQVAELGVASLAGAALGTLAAPGGGTVGGAVAGAVEKGAVQAGVKSFVGKMIDKQAAANVARGMTEKAAAEAAVKTVYGTIGATTANTFLNATQELGSIYGDAVEEAALTGKEYSLGKVWLSGIAATAVDSWADSKAVGKVMDAFKGGKGVGGIAMEAFKGGFREGMTEGVQTAIERWGADKDLASQEAFKEYIDSAAVGVLGGSVSGAGSATIKKAFSPSDKPKADADLTKDLETTKDTAQPNLEAPISIQKEELVAILQSPEAMAYLYSKADDQGKLNIEKAVERAGTLDQFNAVKGQADAINAGQAQFAEFPEYASALDGAIAGYAKGASLNIQKGKTLEAPPSQFDQQYATLETLQPGTMVTLYRGEDAQNEQNGQWWTSNPNKAAKYGKVQSVVLPAEVIGKNAAQGANGADEFVFAGKKPIELVQPTGTESTQQTQPSGARIDAPTPEKLANRKADPSLDPGDGLRFSSSKKPTVSDLPSAIRRVMDQLTESGQMSFQDAAVAVMNRIYASPSWTSVSSNVTPGMLRTAYKSLPLDRRQSDAEVDAVTPQQLRAAVDASQKQKPAKQEKTAAEESRDLDLEILDANKKLEQSLSKDWSKKKVSPAEIPDVLAQIENNPEAQDAFNRLEELKKRQKELVAELEDEAKVAKPAKETKADKKAEKEAKKAEEPEVDYGTYKQSSGGEKPAMMDQQLETLDFRKLLAGMNRSQQGKVRRDLAGVDAEWVNNLSTEGLFEHLRSMPVAERMEALASLAERSSGELVQIGERLAQLNTPEAKQILEFKRRVFGIMNLLNLNAPEADLSTNQDGEVTAKPGVGEEISVASAQQQASFLRGTIAKIQKAIDDIDALLRGSRIVKDEGGKTFVGQDESDENAYLWGEQGFRTAKNLPQDRLLEVRRQLMDQVREMQTRSTRGVAELFKRAAKNAEYQIAMAGLQAKRDGIPAIVVDPIIDQAREQIIGLMNDKAVRQSIEVPSVQEALKVALDEAPLEAGDVVNQLADGIKNRSLTQDEMFTLASTAIRSGRLNQGQLIQALRDRGIDTPQEMLSASPLLAFQTRMMDYLNQHGNHPSYRMAWLNSMDQLVKRHPTLLKLNIFPEAEKVAYEMWKERTDAIANRRTKDIVMENSNDAADAFRDMLFTKYSLSQMRGAVPIPEREMMALKGTIGDMEEAWFQDVNFALKLRPELKSQLLDAEEGMIAPTDVQEFLRWQERNNAKLDREADAKARAPYYEALAAFDGSIPEGEFSGSRLETQLTDEGKLKRDENKLKRDIIYRRLKTMIARAELDELPKIIHNAQQLYTRIASNTKTEAALDQMISDYLDMKQAQDEKINGQTIEQFYGMAERGVADTELTQKELDDMDAEDFEYNFDEDLGDTDEQSGEDAPFRKRGNWSGEYTAAVVDGWIKKITAKWGAAPQVTVLQNATMLPEPLRSKALARTGDLLDAAGLFDSATGHVYVFSDFIGSESDAQFVLFHEVYGHRGMRQFLGAKFDSFLERMYQIYPNVKKAADAFMEERGVGKLEAIDEVLSDMAGTNPDIGPVKSYIGRIVVGLREIGLNRVADWIAKISNVELSYYLKGARDAAQNGGYVSNGAPGLVRLAEAIQHERLSEMFSLRGDKTTAFARFNPVAQQWFVYLANGDDIRANNNTALVTDNYADVLKLMRSKGAVEFRKRSGVFIPDRNASDFIRLPQTQDLTGIKAWMRSTIAKFQNEYRPVFDLVERMRAAGRLSERMDIKGALIDYERKTSGILDEVRRRFFRPIDSLVEEAAGQGANKTIVERYLLARHAQERNEQIARINPKFPDGGSGMKTKVAQRYLKQLQKQPYWQTLEEIGRITDELSQRKLKYMFDTGMITAKQYQAMQVYKHYVNLSGRTDLKLDEFDDPMMLAGGSKFNVKGKEKRAMGRSSEATDILARTILGMEAAIIRGQKNQVAMRVLAFFEANYDPNFVTINKIAYKQVIGDDGMVTDKEDENYYGNKNVMVAKINGIPNTIEFKDTSPDSFAEAIHGVVGYRDQNAVLEQMGKFNRIVGQMLTTWNPAWGAVNFVRDVQTMFFNAAADGRLTKAQAAEMVKRIPEAMKIAFYMAKVENLKKTNIKLTDEQVRVYREMKLNGGLTLFLNRKDLPSQVEEIEKLMGERTRLQNAGDKFKSVFDWIEHNMSLPIEVAPRLAAYMVMRENGFSPAESARFAGEITVNFNMRGSSQAARQLYLFFNPAVQGSAKLLSLFVTLDHDYKLKFKTKGFAYAAAWIGVGALMNLVGRAVGDDDEAGRNALDKVPTWKRATSIVVAPDTPGGAIPIPYGWNAFYAMGHFMMDTLLGIQPLSVTAGRIAKSTVESFAPLGTAGLDSSSIAGVALKGVAPTAALPIVEWVMNENRYGAPIRREASLFGGAQLPDSQMAFRSVNPISKAAMETVNELTGGNKFKSGSVDVNPAAIDFIVGAYLPGFINESYKAAGMGTRIARGEEVKNTPMPLVDRFTAKVPESFDAGAFRRAKEMIETKYNEYENMPKLRDEIRREYPGLMRAHAVVTGINQQIRELNSTLTMVENNERFTDQERVDRLNRTRERIRVLQNKAVKEIMNAGPQFRDAVMASD